MVRRIVVGRFVPSGEMNNRRNHNPTGIKTTAIPPKDIAEALQQVEGMIILEMSRGEVPLQDQADLAQDIRIELVKMWPKWDRSGIASWSTFAHYGIHWGVCEWRKIKARRDEPGHRRQTWRLVDPEVLAALTRDRVNHVTDDQVAARVKQIIANPELFMDKRYVKVFKTWYASQDPTHAGREILNAKLGLTNPCVFPKYLQRIRDDVASCGMEGTFVQPTLAGKAAAAYATARVNDLAKLNELRDQGMTLRQAAAETGISYHHASRLIRR